ncbi:hypothetical protein MVEN_02108700 [Mycena venus]|uniref:F-box domain-containing protein n=1 Tax=Mycena venus TaxID=2733690 RepID=A0A8H6XA18_9AGAR|nr:hypothetical protein MVEN_02108700 [Mycena venus]
MLDKVPVELATEIFCLTLPDIQSDPHPSQSPLSLAHVCQDWRLLAFSTPQLWSNLTLSDAHVHKPDTVLIDQWLGRANLVALRLCVSHSFFKAIMRLISRNSTKWKTLEFHLSIGTTLVFPEFAEIKPIGGFPSLRKLVIESNPRYFHPSEGTVVDGFLNAPLLEELHFNSFPILLNRLSLPWTQLTRFTSTNGTMGVSDALRVLSLTPKLLHARLSTSITSSSATAIPPHLHLKSLSFQSRHVSLDVLRSLTLPALEVLDVGAVLNNDTQTLLSFLARSHCKLTTLSAKTLLRPFIPCLRAIPTLSSVRLTLTDRTDKEDVSVFLQRLGDDTSFLPNLESFTIVGDGALIFPYEALAEALRARSISESFVQLRQVTLAWSQQPFFYPDWRIEPQLIATGIPVLFVQADTLET